MDKNSYCLLNCLKIGLFIVTSLHMQENFVTRQKLVTMFALIVCKSQLALIFIQLNLLINYLRPFPDNKQSFELL